MTTASGSQRKPIVKDSKASGKRDWFGEMAAWTSRVTGGRWGFVTALLIVVVWAATGPYFEYSEDWQLVINTGTTIVTFLMVFLIQNTQNRESKAVHLKLDELVFAVEKARNELIDVENLTEAELDKLHEHYHKLADHYHQKILARKERRAAERAGKS